MPYASNPSRPGSAWGVSRPLDTYRREPPVQELLESWRTLSPRAVQQRVRADVEKRIPLEALVAVARAFRRAGRDDDAWSIVELISDRSAGRTFRHLAVWGLSDGDEREDLTRQILHMMVNAVLSTDPQAEFWECRYWTCFDRRVRSMLRDYRRRNPAQDSWDEAIEMTGDRAVEGEEMAAVIETSASTWPEWVAARDLLARLPEPLRTAFYLKHYAGFRDEGEAGEPTIATALNVTGRTVRNYLRRAEELLAEWRKE